MGGLFDTVAFCLSKGLGAPVGSLVVSDRETITRVHRARKRAYLAGASLADINAEAFDLRDLRRGNRGEFDPDKDRRDALKRMKRVALGLLVLMTVVFLAAITLVVQVRQIPVANICVHALAANFSINILISFLSRSESPLRSLVFFATRRIGLLAD